MSIILRTNMCELKPTNSNELQIEFVDEENISNNEKGGNKKKLKEILKRVYIGIYEDSKNILLLKNTGITHILIIRSSKENNIARIMFPHDFEYYIIDIKEDFDFTVYSHFKCLLDDILFENKNNKLFIHRYQCTYMHTQFHTLFHTLIHTLLQCFYFNNSPSFLHYTHTHTLYFITL